MFVFSVPFSKKSLACCAALVLSAIATTLLLGGCLKKNTTPQTVAAASNADRVAYLNAQGWEITDEPIETLDLQLPEDLSAEYEDYCQLQSSQGLPFDQYGGRQVTRYTYQVTNYPDIADGVQVNLYICDDRVIGGDIMVLGEDGLQRGLDFPQ